MTRGFSIYLDALRFGAAFVVLLSHFAYPRFTEGRWIWIRELNLGSDAVVVFFVLSGLVIAHVGLKRSSDAKQFVFDRVTRLLSVALPALLVGFCLDRIGALNDPIFYDGWFYNPLPLWEILLRGLTFSNEWQGLSARLGTNGPYWSLSYEAAYYMLFAIALYARGAARVALLLFAAVLVGVNVLLLLPAWLMGVAAQRVIANGWLPTGRFALLCAFLPIVAYITALVFGVPGHLYNETWVTIFRLGFSDEFLWNNILAMFVAVHLAGVAGLTSKSKPVRFEKQIRWLAGGSFSLYLLHYPVLQFLGAYGVGQGSIMGDAYLMTLTLVLCYVFATVFERRLDLWRRLLRPLFWRKAQSTGSEAPSV